MPLVRVGNHEFGERTPLIGYGGAEADRKRMRKACRQVITLLVVAYTGYYFVRSNLAVAIPILEDEEISRTKIGFVLGAGYTAFLIGKFLSGTIIRRIGGKTTLLLGLVGSIVTSVLFTFKTTPVWFGTFRFLNQLAESVGWSAVVKIVRGWYTPSEAAHAIAFASLAESGGDAVVRIVLGGYLLYGLGWKEMFYLSAAAGTVLLIPSSFITGQPTDKGLEPPKETGGSGENLQDRSVYARGESGVRPLLKSGRFWILSAQMFGIIFIRESFASFISAFIKEELELSTGLSAIASAIFPGLGAISSLAGGFLLDHVRPTRRGLVPFLCLAVVTAGLGGMAIVSPKQSSLDSGSESQMQMILIFAFISVIALSLYAPKLILDGVFVMDLAGDHSNVQTVTAAVTGLGYVGALVSPFVSGVVADQMGWPFSMLVLACVAGATCAMAAVYWLWDMKKISDSHADSNA